MEQNASGMTMPNTKKKFGQHFLVNQGVVKKILDALELQPHEDVLEIGPGAGALTMPLNQRGFPLTIVEKDPEMASYLAEQRWSPEVKIKCGDALDLSIDQHFSGQVKVVSNLPYNVSVPITVGLVRQAQLIPLLVLMYQREVALRVRAQASSKDYGIVSVLVQCFYDVDLHFDVEAGSFRPPPKVRSQVIRLRRKPSFLVQREDFALLEDLLKLLFKQRRKMVGSVLKKAQLQGIPGSRIVQALEQQGLCGQMRPEALTPEQFASWIRTIKDMHEGV